MKRSASAISIKKLNKSFGSKHALKDVSFAIPEGQISGFLGPNGAGKTTTIRCLMDFIRGDSGEIKVLGMDAREDSVALKAKIGYVPSDHQLNEKWTGEQHITYISQARGVSGTAPEIVERMHLDVGSKVKNLSSGNKQKLSIILALIGNPSLLVLDEPTQGLDPLFQNEIYEILRDFQQTGGTVLISSHNLSEVQRLCSRVVIIRDGQIIAEEPLDSLRALNTHEITVRFAKKVSPKVFERDGVVVTAHAPTEISMKVRGGLDAVVKQLAAYSVVDLQVTHASLEEVFMEMYQ
ncbi:ABC transporter ATP-binding protein [bacterium]|nr:ABC transporter ATP-binding protein [bacterium]